MEYFRQNKILGSLFIIVLLVFVYYFLIPKGSTSVPQVTDLLTTQTSTASTTGQDVVNLLNSVSVARIDTSLFSDATWQSLKEFPDSAANIPPGKSNLFAPLGQ